MSYQEHIDNGEFYNCDFGGCESQLSLEEYEKNILRNDRLCDAHWNYTHLKTGNCDKCGNITTNRSESREINLKCSCGGNIYMVVKDG